jgi:hypothetical protein
MNFSMLIALDLTTEPLRGQRDPVTGAHLGITPDNDPAPLRDARARGVPDCGEDEGSGAVGARPDS